MWPRGPNCSFLQGLSDYFQDIHNHQSNSLDEAEQKAVSNICQSLDNIIQNRRDRNLGTASNDQSSTNVLDEYSLEDRIQKFLEWALSQVSDSNLDWTPLIVSFNARCPQYAIPEDIDVTQFKQDALCRFYKDGGNELMKQKQIESAITMYSKAIALMEMSTSSSPPILDKEENSKTNDDRNCIERGDDSVRNGHDLAVIYCNRSAAYVYLQQYQSAVDDAISALRNDPLLTKAWIRKGMAEQKLKRYRIAYGDYQVALNQSKQTDTFRKYLERKIEQCFEQIVSEHMGQGSSKGNEENMQSLSPNLYSPISQSKGSH